MSDKNLSLMPSIMLSPPKTRDVLLLIGTLENDLVKAGMIKYTPYQEPIILRFLIWTASSYIEGTINGMCQLVLNDSKAKRHLTSSQKLILKDQKKVSGNKLVSYFRPIDQKAESVLLIFAAVYKLSWNIEGKNMTKFAKFIDLRDRITHPSSGDDVVCDDEDKVSIKEGVAWFQRQVNNLLKLYNSKYIK